MQPLKSLQRPAGGDRVLQELAEMGAREGKEHVVDERDRRGGPFDVEDDRLDARRGGRDVHSGAPLDGLTQPPSDRWAGNTSARSTVAGIRDPLRCSCTAASSRTGPGTDGWRGSAGPHRGRTNG